MIQPAGAAALESFFIEWHFMSASHGGREGAWGSNVDLLFPPHHTTPNDIITATTHTLAPALFMQNGRLGERRRTSSGDEEAERRSHRGLKGCNLSDDELTLIRLHFNNERPLRGPVTKTWPTWQRTERRAEANMADSWLLLRLQGLRMRRFRGCVFFSPGWKQLHLITDISISPRFFNTAALWPVHI